jgi:hypothetical protein
LFSWEEFFSGMMAVGVVEFLGCE